MLKIWFKEDGFKVPETVKIYNGNTINVLRQVPTWFDLAYEPEWFNNDMARKVVKGIDNSELHGMNVISPVFDSISVRDLSGGVKTLITLWNYNKDIMIYVGSCGDNCAPYIEEIGSIKDIMILLPYKMKFGKNIRAQCLNDGSEINCKGDYDDMFYKHLVEKRDWEC